MKKIINIRTKVYRKWHSKCNMYLAVLKGHTIRICVALENEKKKLNNILNYFLE